MYKKILINLFLWCGVLKSHKCNTSFSSHIVHVLKAVATVTSEHLNLSTNFAVNQLFGADQNVPWIEVKAGFRDPEKVFLSPE